MGTEAYSITSTFIVHNEPLTAGIMLSVNTPGRHGSKKFKKHTLETMYLYNCGEVKYSETVIVDKNNPPKKHKKCMVAICAEPVFLYNHLTVVSSENYSIRESH